MIRLALVLGPMCASCAVHSLAGAPRTVPKDDTEVTAQLGCTTEEVVWNGDTPRLTFEGVARRGFDDFDLGVRVFNGGGAVESRVQLFGGTDQRFSALVWMLVGLGGAGPSSICSGPASCRIPFVPFGTFGVVFGMRVVPWLELVAAPRVTAEYFTEPIPSPRLFPVVFDGLVFSAGGSVAVGLLLPGGWRFAPEFTLLVPLNPGLPRIPRPYVGLGGSQTF